MHETIVRVFELSSIIEREKWSSENYLNTNKIISYLQIFYNNSRQLEIQDKIRTIVYFYRNVTFKSLISFVIWIKFSEVAFYFRSDHDYFIYFNLIHFSFFSNGQNQDKICNGFFKKFQLNCFEITLNKHRLHKIFCY